MLTKGYFNSRELYGNLRQHSLAICQIKPGLKTPDNTERLKQPSISLAIASTTGTQTEFPICL